MIFMSVLMIAQEDFSYKLSRRIAMMYANPDSTSLCILFANPGENYDKTAQVGIFDLKSRKLIYQSPMFSHREDGFKVLDKGILISFQQGRQYSLRLIDWNGNEVWKEDGALGFIYKNEVDLGLVLRDTGTGSAVEINGISLRTGDILWSEQVDYDFVRNIRGIRQFSNSTVLLLSDKLYKYGRKNGLLAEHKYKTSPQGANASIVVSDHHAYMTDWKNLTCFDKNLAAVWSVSHPAMARNELIDEGKTLKLINYGYVKSDAKIMPIHHLNKPYIACYDKQSGQQLSLDYMTWKKQDGLIKSIYSDTLLYVKTGDAFRQLLVAKNNYAAVMENGDVYLLDNKLQVKEKHVDNDVYYQMFAVDDLVCIGRWCPDGHDFYLLSSEGRSIRHLPDGTTSLLLVGSQLFYSIAETLYITTFTKRSD